MKKGTRLYHIQYVDADCREYNYYDVMPHESKGVASVPGIFFTGADLEAFARRVWVAAVDNYRANSDLAYEAAFKDFWAKETEGKGK